MLKFESIKEGQTIYIVESNPYIVLSVKVLKKLDNRLKVDSGDMTFEFDYLELENSIFSRKDDAITVVNLHIYNETNKFIKNISDNQFLDYYDLEKEIEKIKKQFPEKFI